jgi:hypothetical protein
MKNRFYKSKCIFFHLFLMFKLINSFNKFISKLRIESNRIIKIIHIIISVFILLKGNLIEYPEHREFIIPSKVV